MRSNWLSYTLVIIQFACLAILALTGPWIARNPVLFTVQAAGVVLALWGIASIRFTDLSILPDVKAGAIFVRRGPYRYIRHPMYAGLLLATLPIVLETPTLLRGLTWTVLLADIIMKLRHEERLLSDVFPEYEAYQQQTKRLVPLVF